MKKPQSLIPLLVSLCAAIALSACSDDPGGEQPPGDASDGDTGTDADVGGADAAYMVLNRVQSPEGRSMFVSIVNELDAGELDLGDALELNGFSRARAYNGKVYTFDGEAGQVTRYRVSDSGELEVDTLADGETTARFSMAGEGVSSFSSLIAFISEERAYYFDTLSENQAIVWNPTTMEIISSFDVPEFSRDSVNTDSDSVTVIDDRVVVPLAWVNFITGDFEPTVAIAVFSATEDQLIDVVEDSRCVVTDDTFALDGYVYVNGDSYSGIGEAQGGDEVPPPCMLRWQMGQDSFDSEFYVDLDQVSGEPLSTNMISRGDGTIATMLYTSDTDPSTLGPFALLDGNHWQRAIVDYEEEASTVVDDIPISGVSGKGWLIDNEYHVPYFDEEEGESTFYQMDEDGGTELFTISGEIFLVQQVR